MADKAHIMLDDHRRDAAFPIEPKHDLGRMASFVGRHSGSRFVEQQEPRLGCDGHADLQPLLLSMGEKPRDCVAMARKADQIEQRFDPFAARPVRIVDALRRNANILVYRQLAQNTGDLELHADAAPHHLEWT